MYQMTSQKDITQKKILTEAGPKVLNNLISSHTQRSRIIMQVSDGEEY